MAAAQTYQSEFTGEQMDQRFTAVATLAAALEVLTTVVSGKYVKPADGIPSSDMTAAVQASLAKAESAVQSLADYYTKTEIDQLLAAINGMDYVDVSTLPTASASTMGKIYLLGPDASGYYAYYYTSYDGTSYAWVGPLGTTEISLANYATKTELSQLDQKVNILAEGEYDTDHLAIANGTIANAANSTCVNTSDYIPVQAGDKVYPVVVKATQGEGGYYRYAFRTYDSSKAQKRNVTDVSKDPATPVTIASGEAYIRFTIGEYSSSGTLLTIRATNFDGSTSYIYAVIYHTDANISVLNSKVAANSKDLDALTQPAPINENAFVGADAYDNAIYSSSPNWYVSAKVAAEAGDVINADMPSEFTGSTPYKCGIYNSDGVLTAYVSMWNGRSVTLPSGQGIAFVSMSIRKADADKFALYVNGTRKIQGADLSLSVPSLASKVSDALANNAYKRSAMSAIASQIGIVSPTKPKTHYLCFLHQSDIHGDVERYKRMLRFANTQNNIAAVLVTGDFSSSSYDTPDFEDTYVEGLNLTSLPCFPLVGNHDVTNNSYIGTGDETIANVTARYITPYMDGLGAEQGDGAYYYKDFTSFKIRLIVLCEYEMPRISESGATQYKYDMNKRYISQDQADWFVDALNSVPENYSVIVAMHTAIDGLTLIDNDFTCSVSNSDMDSQRAQGNIIQEIMDAYISKGTLTKTYANTIGASSAEVPDVSVNADFSDAEGEFICYLCGHSHRDYVGKSKYADNQQLCIVISCGTINRTYFAMADDLLREAGSQSEDLFNMIAFDTDRKEIRILRIGASQTADMRHREMTCISYVQS